MKILGHAFGIFLVVMLLGACSTSKEARGIRSAINGNWQLQTVVSEGVMGKIKAQVFNEADFNCFIGSTWNFSSGNSLGSYTISKNADECVSLKRNFRWSIAEAENQPKTFQFKRLDDKLREMDANSGGFKFTILNSDKNAMSMRSDITFEGRPASFTYNFVRL